MRLRDAYSAKAIALVRTEVVSNRIPMLGAALFPSKKKMGLDLKWIKTSKGLPVSLMPSAFDTVSTIRSREGFKLEKTLMAYFKESMIVKEEDEQEILRVQDSADPYAQEVLNSIYDDANTLIDGAEVVPERMIMQLLNPPATGSNAGSPCIYIAADNATYAYNYDPNGDYASNNYEALTGQSKWSDTTNSDPLADVQSAQQAIEEKTGTKPTIGIISQQTMNYLKKNANLRSYILAQNPTANIFMNERRVREAFLSEVGLTLVVYTKMYKDETGTAHKFFEDGYCTLIPEGALGNTWYGTTPDERTLMGNPNYDTALVNTGIAVTVTTTSDPVHTKTTVSEIVLPSYERMDETFVIKAY
ncbi:MAG: major capsid protein [Lachnospiraceae bacterium]|nr:major capsid protein [Lachnospiraceae bacterium]